MALSPANEGLRLVDFSWSFRTILSSSSLAEMERPVVILQMDLEDKGERRAVTMEMDKAQLQSFLTKMKAVADK